jgi:hypothetical protein
MLTPHLLGLEVTLARVDAKRLNVEDQRRLDDVDRLEDLWRAVEQLSHSSASAGHALPPTALGQAMSDLDQALDGYRQTYKLQAPFPQLAKPGRITAPIPGLYAAIDPNTPPGGWTFRDAWGTDSSEPGARFIRTDATDDNDQDGWIQRGYDQANNKVIMANAFLSDLKRWIDHDPPLKQGKGVPLVAYLTMRQMKLFGIGEGQIRQLKMSTIQNVEAILQLEALRRRGVSLIEAVMRTHSVQYAETPMVQSGHRILPGSQVIDGGGVHPLKDLLQHYEDLGRDPAKHDGLLAKYGVDRQDSSLWNYDVLMKVTPA